MELVNLKSSSLKLSLVLLSLCAFAQPAVFSNETASAKASSPQQEQTVTKVEAPVFKTEKTGSSQKLTFSVSVPTNIEDGWQSCLRTTGNAAEALGKNATAVGKWLDDGFKKIDTGARQEQVYVTPLVSSASKYCSKFHAAYMQDGRVKTVSHR
jgi:hypothetical protein